MQTRLERFLEEAIDENKLTHKEGCSILAAVLHVYPTLPRLPGKAYEEIMGKYSSSINNGFITLSQEEK